MNHATEGIKIALLFSVILTLWMINSTLQDIRQIDNEARDAVTCLAYPHDAACLPQLNPKTN